jgi:catechol 2,3-dioxygenase-like lactoylglutathione lyase family enzyme
LIRRLADSEDEHLSKYGPSVGDRMVVQLNHTIVWADDKHASAAFLADVLGLAAPTRYGSFVIVQVDNDVSLDFLDVDDVVHPQHYAFIVSEAEFDEIFERVRTRGLPYWADPGQEQLGEINTRDGGRGFYWEDPNGHLLEILTRPYGG